MLTDLRTTYAVYDFSSRNMATDRRYKHLRLRENHQAVEGILIHGGRTKRGIGGKRIAWSSVAGVINFFVCPGPL
jgi:hypothetical protein